MYFSNEFEPDLGDEFNHLYRSDKYKRLEFLPQDIQLFDYKYKYKFRSEEDMITSDVFQRNLNKSLAFKDAQIECLRKELLILDKIQNK